MLSVCFCTLINAQTTYKGVTIDRDHYDNTSIRVTNSNNYPVQIRLEYKVGSKDAEWRTYIVDHKLNAHYEGILGSVGSKIYGLKLTYVDIEKPSVVEGVLNAFVDASKNQNNGN